MIKKSKKKQVTKSNDTPVYILGVFTIAAFIMMMIALSVTKEPPRGEFVPPAFESMAQQGIPEVPEELDHSSPPSGGNGLPFLRLRQCDHGQQQRNRVFYQRGREPCLSQAPCAG